MEHIKKNLLWVILTAIMAVLLVVVIVGNAIALSYKGIINSVLGLESSRLVKDENDTSNTNYHPSDYDGETSEDKMKADDKFWAEVLSEEGSVLLKNENNALPLVQNTKVSIFGHSSVNAIVCGTGSADIDATGAHDLKYTLEENGVQVNPSLWNFYVDNIETYPTNPKKGDAGIRGGDGTVKGYYTVNEIPVSAFTSEAKSEYSSYNDAAIVVIARIGGEMFDIPASVENGGNPDETVNGSGNMLELTIQERALLQHVSENFDDVIVLVNTANAIEFDFIDVAEYGVDACMWIGYTGLMGLDGVADLLTGVANPSGRIVDTFCVDNTTSPAMANFYGGQWTNVADYGTKMYDLQLDGNMYYNVYQEGIYVGYRYYETRYEDYVLGQGNAGAYDYSADVKYPFGYGLSYTSFEQELVSATESEDGTSFTFEVRVTNTGSVAGKEVVQIYLQSPYTQYDKDNGIEKAAVELCGFTKVPEAAEEYEDAKVELTKLLQPNESQTVTITVDKKELIAYDSNNAKTYILDEGDYYFAIGHNAHDALNNIIALKDQLNDTIQADVNKIFVADNNEEGDAELAWKWTNATFDDETYSVSNDGEENYAITNQLESADLTKIDAYSGLNFKYLSRADWTGTWTTKVQLNLPQAVYNEMSGIKKYEALETDRKMPTMGKLGELTLAMFIGVDYNGTIEHDGKTYTWDDLLDQITYEEMANVIGVGYHGTLAIETVAKPTVVDENGPQGFTGKLTDVLGNAKKATAYTDENVMAATWNVELMERLGEQLGENIRAAGGTGLYGPAMNTHRTPYAGRNFEYYSEDGFLGGKIATAETKGIQSKGCYVFIKHFAFNDQETKCRCLAIFGNEQTLREVYLQPFEHAIVEGGAMNVMSSFSRVGVIWTGGHKGLMTNILRNEWGMEGFNVTDYSNTGTTFSVFDGLLAGTNTWDCSLDTSWAKKLLKYDYSNDPELVYAMRESTHRILYTVANSAAMNGIAKTDRIEVLTNWWQYVLISAIVVFAVGTVACGSMFALKVVKDVKTKKNN